MIDSCYLKVGDSAEVITLLLKNKKNIVDYKLKNTSLNELLIKILPEISVLNNEDRKLKIRDLWQSLPEDNHLVFNKILTGTFRIGVSIGIITKALSKLTNVDEEIVSHRLMGDFQPSIDSYNFLINQKVDLKELNYKPFLCVFRHNQH